MAQSNDKSLAAMFDNVDTSYMTEAEKMILIAQAQRAEYIGSLISAAVSAIKSLFTSKKEVTRTVNTSGLHHA